MMCDTEEAQISVRELLRGVLPTLSAMQILKLYYPGMYAALA